jgi:hypothetical protein
MGAVAGCEGVAVTQVGRGARLALRLGDRRVPLRALADADLAGDWSLPVLALAQDFAATHGDVEIVTEAGVVTLPARLGHDSGGRLVLRPHGDLPAVRVQRREDVRGSLTLRLRAAVLDPRTRPDLADLAFDGATVTVSAGGVSLAPGDGVRRVELLPAGARLFLELELPDGALAPAVLSLVVPAGLGLRGSFVDIAAADRERLVRLVFAEQRQALAARRRARTAAPQP